MKITKKAITDYWLKYYIKDGHCSLCGNHGIIPDHGVTTPGGNKCGQDNFCICPNGQHMRYYASKTNP